MKYSYGEYVPALKALSDETRLSILDALSCGESCACELLKTFEFSQPTLSYHMKILTESGLVISRKDGQWVRYTVDENKYAEVVSFLKEIGTKSHCCK